MAAKPIAIVDYDSRAKFLNLSSNKSVVPAAG